MKKRIAVLGATGSIGKNALDVIACGKNDFEIVLLSANRSSDALNEAGRLWPKAEKILCSEPAGKKRLLNAIANCGAEIAINGVSGSAGFEYSMAAINAGCNLALANKETLVMAGSLVMSYAKEKKIKIIPVDSEHSAIFHLLQNQGEEIPQEIFLSASGGPFLDASAGEMEEATPQTALEHPTWNMGPKISIDSATMANKGLEIMEAVHLFNVPPEKIKVLIHRQSIVHSMVKMKDGAVYAQLSNPDMRLPIHKALYWPGLRQSDFGALDFDALSLSFCKPDFEKFPMLALAYQVLKQGGLYPCAYNGANEAAVNAFLAGRIRFLDIERITRYVLDMDWSKMPDSIDAVLEADKQAKIFAEKEIK
ncbi:MAG: 1-deoxy-D-xylulose-5-phosphate reductoisomerase [Treponema sp.]|nr:1-deoxy-D-xylulose-5-phosphate reductoisomerase [Treponema sp.]